METKAKRINMATEDWDEYYGCGTYAHIAEVK